MLQEIIATCVDTTHNFFRLMIHMQAQGIALPAGFVWEYFSSGLLAPWTALSDLPAPGSLLMLFIFIGHITLGGLLIKRIWWSNWITLACIFFYMPILLVQTAVSYSMGTPQLLINCALFIALLLPTGRLEFTRARN